MTTPKVVSRTSKDLDTEYKWGFTTDIKSDIAPKGLNEDVVRMISAKKGEPEFLLDWRLRAYEHWKTLDNEEPRWAMVDFPPIDYQDLHYYASPFVDEKPESLDDVDPELIEAFDKLASPSKSRSA